MAEFCRRNGIRKLAFFGSVLTNRFSDSSDIDVLVVVPDGTHRLHTTRYIYQQMAGFAHPVDIVVTTPSVLEQHKNNIGLIYRSVLAEGKEIYAA